MVGEAYGARSFVFFALERMCFWPQLPRHPLHSLSDRQCLALALAVAAHPQARMRAPSEAPSHESQDSLEPFSIGVAPNKTIEPPQPTIATALAKGPGGRMPEACDKEALEPRFRRRLFIAACFHRLCACSLLAPCRLLWRRTSLHADPCAH